MTLWPDRARRLAPALLTLLALVLPQAGWTQAPPRPAPASPVSFEKRVLTDGYYCDGVTVGDINRDGRPDVVAGPFWFEGPDFKVRHAFYPAEPFDPAASPTNSMFSYVHDFNGDGWPDILVLGRVHLHEAAWYENPRGKPGRWLRHFVFARVRGESPPFVDVDGDGRPELVAHWDGRWGFLRPDPKAPTRPWAFHPITARGEWNQFYHGTGIGDLNGDGRPDLLLNDGWWEQPAPGASRSEWQHHPFRFGMRGGAQMFAYDVDGDGHNDVLTALDAHGWGLAWFRQVREKGQTTFRKHVIMGNRAEAARYGVAFSQPHALALADLDGDGLKDLVVGKRRWAHGPRGDVEPEADPVLYWFQLVREPGKDPVFRPHRIDDRSGVGVQITVADVDGDGRPDVLTASKLGVFLFLNRQPVQGKAGAVPASADRPRLAVLTDIGGDPDDQQSLVRLLTYANEFEIEALIASAAGTPGELKADTVKPHLIRETIDAYGRVRANLLLHAPGYPSIDTLRSRVHAGNPRRGKANIGADRDTDGSRAILAAADRPDPRPLHVVIWGGSTDLAQALWRVRADRGPEGLQRFLARLRVHAIGHQDDTGPWIVRTFPGLFYVLATHNPEDVPGTKRVGDRRLSAYRGMYLGGDESLTAREWIDRHVRLGHGPLGALYPPKTWTAPNPHGALKEGDTPSWFAVLPNGLGDPEHPEWGGWGGRYRAAGNGLYRDSPDTVAGVTDARASVWRWRPAFQNDFQARMDWCVRPRAGANHSPRAGFRGAVSRSVVRLSARAGERLSLDAAGSHDPDGDRLAYRWWVYREAGTYPSPVSLEDDRTARAVLRVPADVRGKTIHVILEVSDDGTPPLTAYRRVIVTGVTD